MKYIAAYALLVLGGKADPAAADVEKLLKEAGIKSEGDHVEKLVKSLNGKKFHELVAAGNKKMSAMGPVAAPAAGAHAKPEAKKEVKEEKPKEEEADVDMGGLFGEEY
jgi:large subunit ribosomal protein LP2